MFCLNVHPNPAIHRFATTVKGARATTRCDSSFQRSWNVKRAYLESLLISSATFFISVEYFNCWFEENTGKHLKAYIWQNS